MKKVSLISTFLFFTFIFSSCSVAKKQEQKKENRNSTPSIQTKIPSSPSPLTVEKKSARTEYTHELAEADADDQSISQEVGEKDIDQELEKSEGALEASFISTKRTKRVEFWIDFFAHKNRERFQRFINNGEEYRPIIEEILSSQGLPKELYYVGLIESGYYLNARSHAGATGPWQFIQGTGKRYGLKITSELDERQDIFKATRAAALYFKDLHNVFSNWELALSAYNAGEYGIIRRIMRYGTRDFYELSRNKQLPSETINYVPKIIAAMHIINNPKMYGLEIPQKKKSFLSRTHLIPMEKNTSLNSIAMRLGLSKNLIQKLNPELKASRTPRYYAGTYLLRVPKSQKEINRRTADNETAPPSFYPLKKDLSPLVSSTPSAKRSVKRVVRNSSPKIKIMNRPVVYKIRRGDNLSDLAKLFDVKVSKIQKINKIRKGKVVVGQKIILPDTRKGIYTVKKGDHLKKVARQFKRPMEALIKLNSLKKGALYPGQKIIVNMD